MGQKKVKYKIALIGGVTSTETTLYSLHKHDFTFVDVYGFEPLQNTNVSGYRYLKNIADNLNYNYYAFKNINDHALDIINRTYDFIMVVGLSQLVCNQIITSAKIGCIGFHPTKLPKGRGRAPIAWLVLNEIEGAASFFQIKPDTDADSGPLLVQSVFEIDNEHDTAASVENKILTHIELALGKWLPNIANGEWSPLEQDQSLSSEYGVRKPEDGFVNWYNTSHHINKIIRSSMPPHPGAFAFKGSKSFEIRNSKIKQIINIEGVVGRILKKINNNYLVQTGEGSIWIETDIDLKVGTQLGTNSPYEIFQLYKKIQSLEEAIRHITHQKEN